MPSLEINDTLKSCGLNTWCIVSGILFWEFLLFYTSLYQDGIRTCGIVGKFRANLMFVREIKYNPNPQPKLLVFVFKYLNKLWIFLISETAKSASENSIGFILGIHNFLSTDYGFWMPIKCENRKHKFFLNSKFFRNFGWDRDRNERIGVWFLNSMSKKKNKNKLNKRGELRLLSA